MFHNRKGTTEQIEFYRNRKDYYEHYGFTDIIYALLDTFEKHNSKIPRFGQVVVDEFQDFNALEVSLIDLLAQKSPILIAGDDDQALYESLKSASAIHIRQRYNDNTLGYMPFNLPYCSRCTCVIVDAVNDIITEARKRNYLQDRISKPFKYFNNVDKDVICCKNPNIYYAQVYDRRIPWFITERIHEIAEEERCRFTVLIISPTKTKSRLIVNALEKKGFTGIQFIDKKQEDEPTLFDGLLLLLKNKNCNLGWRIVARNLLQSGDFEVAIKESSRKDAPKFSDIVKDALDSQVSRLLKTLRAVRDGRKVKDEANLSELFCYINLDVHGMASNHLRGKISAAYSTSSKLGLRKTPITATTVQS